MSGDIMLAKGELRGSPIPLAWRIRVRFSEIFAVCSYIHSEQPKSVSLSCGPPLIVGAAKRLHGIPYAE